MNIDTSAVCLKRRFKRLIFKKLIFSFASLTMVSSLSAFDGAIDISPAALNPENFLDIQSYSFAPEQNRKWRRSASGWRMTGGSLGMDHLYLHFQVKHQYVVTDEMTTHFVLNHEEFYEIKPLRYHVGVEWEFWRDWSFGFLGMPQYDKRRADYGGMLRWGDLQNSYIMATHLRQDLFYNEKNSQDDSEMNPHAVEDGLQMAWLVGAWEVFFAIQQSSPMKLESSSRRFQHQSQQGQFLIEQEFSDDAFWAIESRTFRLEKSREFLEPDKSDEVDEAQSNEEPNTALLFNDERHQVISYLMVHSFLEKLWSRQWSGTLGVRYDEFGNDFEVKQSPKKSEEFQLVSTQVYNVFKHHWKPQYAWEYGLYAGWVERTIDYPAFDKPPDQESSFQAKLRISFEILHEADTGSLLWTTTYNLDELLDNFWDGGNITYQKTF